MKNFVLPIPLTSVTSASVSGTYIAINDAGLPHACSIIRIINVSSQAVTISYGGGVDHDYLPSGQSLVLDLQTNSSPTNYSCLLRKGTVISVKGTAGTGFIALAGYYQEV